ERRDPRAHGPERVGQVHARQRDHGAPQLRGHRGADPPRRHGPDRGRARRAGPDGPVHGVPVSDRGARGDSHQVPAERDERAPRGGGRGPGEPEGLAEGSRGRDGAHPRAEGILVALPERAVLGRRAEAHADPPAGLDPRRGGGGRLTMEAAATTTVAPLDVARIAAEFPILSRRIQGKPLTYLDSAATAQKPQAVLDALYSALAEHNANIHRGVYPLA